IEKKKENIDVEKGTTIYNIVDEDIKIIINDIRKIIKDIKCIFQNGDNTDPKNGDNTDNDINENIKNILINPDIIYYENIEIFDTNFAEDILVSLKIINDDKK
ncbi:17418_t:CDS:1, partial [Dentiscutata heterogama]